MPNQPAQGVNVPIGLASLLGSGAALTAFVLAIVSFIDGDRSEETIGALVTGLLLVVSVVWSRTSQANTVAAPAQPLVKDSPGAEINAPAVAPQPYYTFSAGSTGTTGGTFSVTPQGAGDLDDSAHAATDGDTAEPTGEPIDEDESAPDDPKE